MLRSITILFALLSLPLFLAAQMPKHYGALSAKVLLIDYGFPNDVDDLSRTFGLEFAYRHQFGRYIGVAVPLKVGVADLPGTFENSNILSLDGLVHVFPLTSERKWSPYILGGAGYVLEDMENGQLQIPVGLGLNWQVGENAAVNIQGEYRASQTDLRNNVQLGLGYVYRFGKLDTDGDGVEDSADACPEVAGAATAAGCPDRDADGVADSSDDCPDLAGRASTKGCPDADRDGVADKDDNCPDVAGKVMGCPDTDGDGVADKDDDCPAQAGLASAKGCPDTDGDGIADPQDKCPREAGSADNGGCPVIDRDKDGVVDPEDACPDQAGPLATRGCPDRDADGVADKDDRCPDKAGPYAGCPDTDGDGIHDGDDRCPEQAGLTTNKGCPEMRQEVREVLNLAMRAVQFETGSTTLKRESFTVLDQIAAIMSQYPAYSLTISGHTDNAGDDAANQILSEGRAKTCYDYLVSKGVASGRMRFAGFGETQPISDNKTATGRALNRRVEFDLRIN